jgi:hypothetical protein
LQEFAAACPQNLYARRSSALFSLSVTHNVYLSSERAASMFCSVPLTMAAEAILVDLGVRQLALRIPFEGVAQREAVKKLRHSCRFAAVKMGICANQVNRFYIDT